MSWLNWSTLLGVAPVVIMLGLLLWQKRRMNADQRRELIESGILVPDGANYAFTADQFFASASAAASVIAGQNHNADHWLADDGANLGDLLRQSRAKAGA